MNDVTSAIIAGYLKQLRLPAIAQHQPNVAREAEEDGRSYLEFLQALLEAEVTGRKRQMTRTFPLVWAGGIVRSDGHGMATTVKHRVSSGTCQATFRTTAEVRRVPWDRRFRC